MLRRRRQYFTDPFTDLLFNALLGFTFLFMVALVLVNPVTKLGKVNLKAEYIVTLTWPSSQPDDVDLWVRDPLGQVVSYLQRDVGWLHLDRDDRGDANDIVIIDGETHVNPINREVVTLRGVVAGEYTVNLYYYESVTGTPVTVTVQVDKVNPVLEVLYAEQILLERKLDEVTAIRFTLDDAGELKSLSKLPRVLTPYKLEPEAN